MLFHRNRYEARGSVGLQLPDQVHVGGNDRADHEVAAARNGVAMQNDRLGPAGTWTNHRVASVDDVGGVGASPNGGSRGTKSSVARHGIGNRSISLRRHFPGILEEVPARRFRDTMPIQTGHHAQFCERTGCTTQPRRNLTALGDLSAGAERSSSPAASLRPDIRRGRQAYRSRANRERPAHRRRRDSDIGAAPSSEIKCQRLTFLTLNEVQVARGCPSSFGGNSAPVTATVTSDVNSSSGPRKVASRTAASSLLPTANWRRIARTVHAARDRNADMIISGSAKILHCGRKTGFDDFNGHRAPCQLGVGSVDVGVKFVQRKGDVGYPRGNFPASTSATV